MRKAGIRRRRRSARLWGAAAAELLAKPLGIGMPREQKTDQARRHTSRPAPHHVKRPIVPLAERRRAFGPSLPSASAT